MSRYYVTLEGATEGSPYIIAEITREHGDDGSDRHMSLAANLAGEAATIWTREELQASRTGRSAIRRWESKDDSSFELENIVLSGDRAIVRRPAGTALSRTELDPMGMTIRARLQSLLGTSSTLIDEQKRRLLALRGSVEDLRETRIRSGLAPDQPADRRTKRKRHLRSVS